MTTTIHPSGLFSYARSAPGNSPGVTDYMDCTLLATLDDSHREGELVTFHQPAHCTKNQHFAVICQSGPGLMGWKEEGSNEPVLDIVLK